MIEHWSPLDVALVTTAAIKRRIAEIPREIEKLEEELRDRKAWLAEIEAGIAKDPRFAEEGK